MRSILIVLALLIFSFFGKAQTVTIPDQHFANWLNLHVPGAITGNQLDTSNVLVTGLTSMDVSHDTICNLEGIQYFRSLRNLDCSNNKLDTLMDLPDSLKTLNCSVNRLIYIHELPDSLLSVNCSGNQLDSLPALPNLISLDCRMNSLTSLPALPVSLTYFDCSENYLGTLPALPPALPSLLCSKNKLTSLPLLPDSIRVIDCNNNLLTSLPALPTVLRTLDCSYNLLASLSVLPDSLFTIDCSNNQLAALPSLPIALLTLTCSFNHLSSLPGLPGGLITLRCNSNQLTGLPSLPPSLNQLNCGTNNIPVLPSLPASLDLLDCQFNQLPVLPALTSSLHYMDCSHNYLTVIPSLPATLSTLVCSYNPLADLPSLPASLHYLDCNNSTLDSIPALPLFLNDLNCSFNSLSTIPALSLSTHTLICNNNLLTDLPPLTQYLMYLDCSYNSIHCFQEFPAALQSLEISGNPFTCLPNYLPVMSAQALSYPLCIAGDTVNNANGCIGAKGITGFTYIDNNSSCLRDSLDSDLTYIPLVLLDSTGQFLGQTYSAVNGVYHFPELPGSYTVEVDTAGMPISPQCTNPGIDSMVTVTSADPLVPHVNFGFNCKPGFDIGVRSVVNTGLVFPGEPHQLRVDAGDMTQWYNMACAAGLSGQLQMTITGPVTFINPLPGSLIPVVSANTYTYSVADFGTIVNMDAFGLELMVDPAAGDGDEICVAVNVTPSANDNDTSNNSFNFCYKVVNSHDPNIKETYPENIALNYEGWLTYTIHFQNTGSAPAINIVLKDTLDSQLDVSTFQPTAFSHVNQVIQTGNALTIKFPHINLTDSTSDADSSKGYFQYRIKPLAGLGCGTKIHNTASIYFDFNPAVVTNTTTNSYPSYPEPLAVSDTSVCNGNSLTLNLSSENNQINWYDGNNTLLHSGNTLSLQHLTSGSVIHVQALSAEGCTGSMQNINVTVMPPVSSPLASLQDTICVRDTLALSASSVSGWVYHWSGPAGFSSSAEDPQLSHLSVNNSGFYQLYVSNGDCLSDTAGVYIQVDSLPFIVVTNNPYICYGDEAELSAHGNLRNITWSSGQHSETITVSPSASTLYTVSGSNACGNLLQNIFVTVYQLPVAIALDATLINGESTPLHAEGGLSYSWYPGNGLNCSDCANPMVSLTESQYYSVTVTDEHGCMDTTDMFVNVVDEKNTAYIPNSFTPNGDGLNDEFSVSGTNIKDLQMIIYERSGAKMFESKGRSCSWNGILKSQELGAGTYVYTVRIIFEEGSIANRKGYVTVVR